LERVLGVSVIPKLNNNEGREVHKEKDFFVSIVTFVVDYRVWDLGFGIWDLGFGIWDLGFGIC
jgi:hypothetical protein